MQHYKNWIFDWSGTLADDVALVVDATNHVMRQYGKEEFCRESFQRSFRLPYEQWYAEVIPGVDLEEIEAHFRTGFSESDLGVPMLEHAVPFLERLRSSEKRIFACTSMDPLAFEDQANEHSVMHFFEKAYAGVLDKRELILDILEVHQLNPEETIFVGDMIHDIETAHHGGIDSLAVLTGYNTKAELQSAQPTFILDDLSSALSEH